MHYGSAVHTASRNVAATTSSRMGTSLRTGGKTEKVICEIRFFAAGVVDREHVNIGTACNDFTVPSGPRANHISNFNDFPDGRRGTRVAESECVASCECD